MNFNFLKNMFSGDDSASPIPVDMPLSVFNPATGLPMIDNGMGGVDVGGSPFGMDLDSSTCTDFTGSDGLNSWD